MIKSIEGVSESARPRAAIREGRHCRSLLKRMLLPMEDVDSAIAADRLIGYFGSLRATLAATSEEQHRAIGDERVVRFLGVVRQSMRWVLRDEIEEKTLITSPEALRTYLKFNYGCDQFEQLRVFYLNANGGLLREHAFDRGSPDQVVACPTQIISRGLELNARLLIMAHNHPSGDPTPSKQDLAVTRRIAIGAHGVGMMLFEHLIVAEARDFSFRENGLL